MMTERIDLDQAQTAACIYVVDDDPGVRASLADLFGSVGYQVSTYGSVAEFLEQAQHTGPGCLILDVRLPGLSGLEFQEQLAQRRIHLPTILMSGHGDIPMTVRAIRAGALDFIEKPFRDQHMLDAVSAAVRESRQRIPQQQFREQLEQRFASLTPRERDVVEHVVRGRLNKQIASDLSISEVTVKIHRAAVMRKMEAGSIAELARMAETLGMK
jgi:FixJ family two-component response regulator